MFILWKQGVGSAIHPSIHKLHGISHLLWFMHLLTQRHPQTTHGSSPRQHQLSTKALAHFGRDLFRRRHKTMPPRLTPSHLITWGTRASTPTSPWVTERLTMFFGHQPSYNWNLSWLLVSAILFFHLLRKAYDHR